MYLYIYKDKSFDRTENVKYIFRDGKSVNGFVLNGDSLWECYKRNDTRTEEIFWTGELGPTVYCYMEDCDAINNKGEMTRNSGIDQTGKVWMQFKGGYSFRVFGIFLGESTEKLLAGRQQPGEYAVGVKGYRYYKEE